MNVITFNPDADPIVTARVSSKIAKSLKPPCLDCGRVLSAKDLRSGRLCLNHPACRLRRILHRGYWS